MCVRDRSCISCFIMVPDDIWYYQYSDGVWIVFGRQSCPMYCLLGYLFVVWVCISNSLPFVLEGYSNGSKDNIAILFMFQRVVIGGTRSCLLKACRWYCCQSHFNLVVGMKVRYLPVSSQRWVTLFCVCIICFVVVMSFSKLHSFVIIWVYGIISGGGIDLVSLFCIGVKYVLRMFLQYMCWYVVQYYVSRLVLCLITSGWLNGKSSLCGSHLLYIVWSCNSHWYKYELQFFVILYLSLVSFSSWFIMACIGNLFGLFIIFAGGDGCWGCCGRVRCSGPHIILGCSSLLYEMYCVLIILV